ncbi:unnamed protein product, partial [Hermetia illucens]
ELKKHNVSTVVRVCEPSYKTDELEAQGIAVKDLAFEDGTFPPQKIVDEWFETLKQNYSQNPEACVAVHCVAGLGRAPVLVALALIELGLKYEAAVEMIRDKRRGAINAKQLSYLEKYKPKSRLKHKNGHKNSCCQLPQYSHPIRLECTKDIDSNQEHTRKTHCDDANYLKLAREKLCPTIERLSATHFVTHVLENILSIP